MVYNAVLILVAVAVIVAVYFMFNAIKEAEYNIGYTQGKLEGWEEGFSTAKNAYYISPNEDANTRRIEIEKMNRYAPNITPEILMAYGVDSSAKLPKEIRDAFGMKDGDETVELDRLVQEEVNNGR